MNLPIYLDYNATKEIDRAAASLAAAFEGVSLNKA